MPVAQNLILRAVAGAAQGEAYTLTPGARVVIGRGPDATLRIDDRSVSRQHVELRWDGVRAALRDLGSLAGTLVDGRLVSEAALRPGQRIQMGETTLLIEVQRAKSRIIEAEPISR
jgi:pSer/pThr/pTyr-binding forkhead associated (FHA) protein